MESLVSLGGLALVTPMLTSTHVRMQNEALVSLSILSATLDEDTIHANLHTDLVINSIKNIICKESVPDEVKVNAVTLTKQLLKHKTEEFRQMVKDLRVKEEIQENEKAMKIKEVKELMGSF